MRPRSTPPIIAAGVAVIAALAVVAGLLLGDRSADDPAPTALSIAEPAVATAAPVAPPATRIAVQSGPPASDPAPERTPSGEADTDCDPNPAPPSVMRADETDPIAWAPPVLPGDTVCDLVGGTPWRPAADLHEGRGAELAELRARPLLLGSDAAESPSPSEIADLESLAEAYERWLAAWPLAVRSWSSDPYAALASPAALAERDRLFTHPPLDWGPAWPTCTPFARSDAWLAAGIYGDVAVTYSWRRGEAARCTDDATGRTLPTATTCVGPLYAVAAQWQRNPGGNPPWLMVSETHRDPLHNDGPQRFGHALAGAEWGHVLVLHTAYKGRIAVEEAQTDYSACELRAPPDPATVSSTQDSNPLAALAPAAPAPPPQWAPSDTVARFWIGRPGEPGTVAIAVIGGDHVPYDGEDVPAADPSPGDVRLHVEDVGGGLITHCRDLSNGRPTCWARAGWLVRDTTQDAPWLGAPSIEELGSGWDYCRSVGGEDLGCWQDGFLPPAGALPGRPAPQPPEVIPAAWRDPLYPGRPFCRRAPAGGQLCWLAYDVPDGGIWRPIVPIDAIHSSGRPDPAVACRFGADGAGRDRAFCAPTAEDAALIAADPDQQPVYPRPDGSLCVRHSTGEACWTPRPDITQHRPALWYLP